MSEKRQPNILRALCMGAAFGIGWMAILWINAQLGFGWGLPKNAFEQSALFGDSFAPFVGFLTAAALLLAIRGNQQQTEQLGLQRQELALTREELKLTRHEMKGQREAQEAQAKTARLAGAIELTRMQQDLIVGVVDAARGGNSENLLCGLIDISDGTAQPVARDRRHTHFVKMNDRIVELQRQLATESEDDAKGPPADA